MFCVLSAHSQWRGDDELTLLKFKSNKTSFAVCFKAVQPAAKFSLHPVYCQTYNSLYSAVKCVVSDLLILTQQRDTFQEMTASISVAQDGWRESYSLFPAIDTQRQLCGYGELLRCGNRTILERLCVCVIQTTGCSKAGHPAFRHFTHFLYFLIPQLHTKLLCFCCRKCIIPLCCIVTRPVNQLITVNILLYTLHISVHLIYSQLFLLDSK